ncbi:peptide chain release factor N(5)-glutamine methyltransferase [Sanguibacter sp. YZGR15]|uniref:peptide chain release factor N(5)-glutamine methyltransferase n=1 Tax=Sanguibacter suaedae TaxID=2795737 RepID=A0A934IFP4_9MICO|nr:peptide chain release factor N(5)-glutamine methyltransferase [Sanguibacter suaedae]
MRAAERRLADAGVASPRSDAETLLAHATHADRADVVRAAVMGRSVGALVRAGGPGESRALEDFDVLVGRRAAREPLQHLVGHAAFRHLVLEVGPGVFVPRPETEVVAQVAVDEARAVATSGRAPRVVDLCTGSGAIALAVATEVATSEVHAVELDRDAHAWASRNVEGLAPGRLRLLRADARRALADLDGTCDVVVSNPPYVPPDAVPRDPEVARHDPAVALYGLGPDGLEVPRGVTAAAARLLRDGGLYVMEHAESQAEAARSMVRATGAFVSVETREDLTGRPRMVVGRRNDAAFVGDFRS